MVIVLLLKHHQLNQHEQIWLLSVEFGKSYYSHKSVAIKMDTTWISKIGYLRIVRKVVCLQFRAIWQTKHLWNKKGFLRSHEDAILIFWGGPNLQKVVYHPVFNSMWSNLVGSKCIPWGKFLCGHFWKNCYIDTVEGTLNFQVRLEFLSS